MKEHCLALDLKNDASLIEAYDAYHKDVWPDVIKSIKDSGIVDLSIYRIENRLFMIMKTKDDFSFEKKAKLDESNEKVQEWETLMWEFQQRLPFSAPGEKWVLMEKIFQL